MRKVLIVALGLASAGTCAQIAFAKSACEERRDACYSASGQADKDAAGKCDAEYSGCVGADSSAQAKNPVVPTVTGLGTPMVQPYPTAAVPVNHAATVSSAGQAANSRAVGALVKTAPPAGGGTPPQGNSSSQGGSSSSGGGTKPGSNGSSTVLKQN